MGHNNIWRQLRGRIVAINSNTAGKPSRKPRIARGHEVPFSGGSGIYSTLMDRQRLEEELMSESISCLLAVVHLWRVLVPGHKISL